MHIVLRMNNQDLTKIISPLWFDFSKLSFFSPLLRFIKPKRQTQQK